MEESTPFPVQFEFTQIYDMLMFRLSRWQGRQLLVEDCFSLSAYYFQTNSLRGKLLYLLPLLPLELKKKISRNPWSQYYHPLCPSTPILFGMWYKSSFYCLVSFSRIYVISKKREIGPGRGKGRRGGEFGNKSCLEQNRCYASIYISNFSSGLGNTGPDSPTFCGLLPSFRAFS